MIAGGAVKLQGSTVDLKGGSVVDVSGGALVATTGKFTYGAGGAVTLAAGRAYFAGNAPATLPVGGTLRLAATLKGYAGVGQAGGSLALTAPAINVMVPESAGAAAAATSASGRLGTHIRLLRSRGIQFVFVDGSWRGCRCRRRARACACAGLGGFRRPGGRDRPAGVELGKPCPAGRRSAPTRGCRRRSNWRWPRRVC
ncbi:MAG: hypothetical protein WDM96_09705 [Lacunisphaera sp.]